MQYKVRVNDGGLTEDEIYIYDFVPAKYDICMNSMMYATVVSPIAHLLVDYKNLRQAQIRRLVFSCILREKAVLNRTL